MAITRHISALSDLAAKRVIKQFAAKHHMVYFGSVNAREDEHELVRGLTASINHTDKHYTVGTINGRDVILVQRSNTLTFPGKGDVRYNWLIMQFDLAKSDLPHLFIAALGHHETFYANLLVRQPQFQDMTSWLSRSDPPFARHFKLLALPHHYSDVQALLPPQLTAALAKHFAHFDIEIIEDRLYLYSNNTLLTNVQLQHMAQAGVWLAEQLDAR